MTTAAGAPDVAVVVCAHTFNRWKDLVDCVRALAAQTLPPTEVVVVADHNDELADFARAELPTLLPSLTVVRNSRRRGLSGARNTGVASTTAPVVAFLDDDAIPQPSWLAELVEPLADPRVFLVGGRSVPAWPTSRPRWWPAEFDWVVRSSHRGMPTELAEVPDVLGCSMVVRREVFALAGDFGEHLGRVGRTPLGCVEAELCDRLRRRRPGARVVYTPKSVVHHRVGVHQPRFPYFAARCRDVGNWKALVRATAGIRATAAERDYVLRTLPAAALRGVTAALRGDRAGLLRAATVIAGLLITGYGYLLGARPTR